MSASGAMIRWGSFEAKVLLTQLTKGNLYEKHKWCPFAFMELGARTLCLCGLVVYKLPKALEYVVKKIEVSCLKMPCI
jgi:hypothetical protein